MFSRFPCFLKYAHTHKDAYTSLHNCLIILLGKIPSSEIAGLKNMYILTFVIFLPKCPPKWADAHSPLDSTSFTGSFSSGESLLLYGSASSPLKWAWKHNKSLWTVTKSTLMPVRVLDTFYRLCVSFKFQKNWKEGSSIPIVLLFFPFLRLREVEWLAWVTQLVRLSWVLPPSGMRWGWGCSCPSRQAGSCLLSGYSCAPALCTLRRKALPLLSWEWLSSGAYLDVEITRSDFPEGLGEFPLRKNCLFTYVLELRKHTFSVSIISHTESTDLTDSPPLQPFPICGHLSGAPGGKPCHLPSPDSNQLLWFFWL